MTAVIGWYAHHVGAGHVMRATTVARRTDAEVVVLSSATRPDGWPADRWVALPTDAGDGGTDHRAGGSLHWAPLQHAGFRDRMSLISSWVADARPAALVSDVSVEVLLLGRLLGVPTVGVAMAGDRLDRPHQTGYDAATRLVAAWPRGAAPVVGWQPRWDTKTVWTGALSRFDGRATTPPPGSRSVALLWGRGSDLDAAAVDSARAATPGWRWSTVASDDPDEVWRALQAADVVVTHAGQNALAEVAAARRPAVVLPQPRPHDEQVHLARSLRSAAPPAPAVVRETWPPAAEWPALLGDAAALGGGAWAPWSDGLAADRFAAALDDLVVGRAA